METDSPDGPLVRLITVLGGGGARVAAENGVEGSFWGGGLGSSRKKEMHSHRRHTGTHKQPKEKTKYLGRPKKGRQPLRVAAGDADPPLLTTDP